MKKQKLILILIILILLSGCSKKQAVEEPAVTANIAAFEPVKQRTPEIQKATITGDYVNLRGTPSRQGKIIKQFRVSANVEVLSTTQNQASETWYEVNDNGAKGWVIEQFVKVK